MMAMARATLIQRAGRSLGITTGFPLRNHLASISNILAYLATHALGIFDRKLIGQQLQQITGPSSAHAHTFVIGSLDISTKKLHLAPQIVLQTPTDKCFGRHLFFAVALTGFLRGRDLRFTKSIEPLHSI